MRKPWLKTVALFTVSLVSQSWLIDFHSTQPVFAQANSCAEITNPLTSEEETYARTAWQYFLNNYQPETGFTNSTGGYPSGTLWDMGNYLMALNAARWLNLIAQAEFDQKLNKFLSSLSSLKLFEDSLPNKVYNAATGEMVDYGNNVIERGIGWSALDIGRILAAFHVLRTCHPQYEDWLQSIVDRWAVERSMQDGYMFGATVLEDGQTLPVQEGRLGYEEYAARGYQLWGFNVPVALSFEPFKLVEIYGVKIPVDTRNYQATNANNYVVSESYILDGIEFGFLGKQMQDYAGRILEVQKRRYEATGQLTAITEDNIDGAPYFLYNTIFANGVPWATITEKNELYPQLRSISTKAAFGWRYIFPESEYAQKLFEVAKGLMSPDGGGFYAGLYEETNQPNTALTGNTNGLIMEILYYKARGNRPLIGSQGVDISTGKPEEIVIAQDYPPPANYQNNQVSTPPPPRENKEQKEQKNRQNTQLENNDRQATEKSVNNQSQSNPQQIVRVTPIPQVGEIQNSACGKLTRPLSFAEKRYASAAWSYFESNYHAETGLVSDRSDMKAATLWGLGDYLVALQAAFELVIIPPEKFDTRVRTLLGSLQQLPLFAGELPHRGYDIRSLQPVDYGNNFTPEGTGWSGLDVGRILLAFHHLKSCYPQYTEAIDSIVLDWSYFRVITNGRINAAIVEKDSKGRILTRVYPVNELGYEEYAARGFQLWGFAVDKSAVGGEYETLTVSGKKIPTRRLRGEEKSENPYTVSNPFLRYGLELGFDPAMRSLFYPILEIEAAKYQTEGVITASGTALIQKEPYVIHSAIIAKQEPWVTLIYDGSSAPEKRVVSTAAAFSYYALSPQSEYTQALYSSILDLYHPRLGYYEGFYESNGEPAFGFTATTNSIILQALLYRFSQQKPLLVDKINSDSPWWQAIKAGNSGNGLPTVAKPQIRLVNSDFGTYWTHLTSDTSEVSTSVKKKIEITEEETREDGKIERVDDISYAANDKNKLLVEEVEESIVEKKPSSKNNLAEGKHPHPRQVVVTPENLITAKAAWEYFESNWNETTGLVNAVENYQWTTLWDQGSAILGIHSAYQLGIIPESRFRLMMDKLLTTLEKLPITATGLPNKAYSTANAQMRTLDNKPDPNGASGWSALDTSRFLLSLHILRIHYPAYRDRINQIVEKWQLEKLVNNGWLQGGIAEKSGIKLVQEGRLGYEQYAAYSLKFWGIEAENALYNPPITTINLEGITLQVDKRNLANSGASNYLTNDPYLLWGLEIGWQEEIKPQINNLLQVQRQRYEKTQILTAVNEDSLDRFPYFLYYSIHANNQNWNAISSRGKSFPKLKFLSTKAAFAWHALFPQEPYTQKLKAAVNNLFQTSQGFPTGKYEDKNLGINQVFNVNTNAIILESILYQSNKGFPLVIK